MRRKTARGLPYATVHPLDGCRSLAHTKRGRYPLRTDTDVATLGSYQDGVATHARARGRKSATMGNVNAGAGQMRRFRFGSYCDKEDNGDDITTACSYLGHRRFGRALTFWLHHCGCDATIVESSRPYTRATQLRPGVGVGAGIVHLHPTLHQPSNEPQGRKMMSTKDAIARTLHIATDDLPWVTTSPGFEMRVLHARPEDGFTVSQIRAQPGVVHGWHRHNAPVFGYTTAGAWGHDESYEYRPGTYIFETPGVVHRFLNGPEVTEATFISYSDAEFINLETNEVTGRLTRAGMLEIYLRGCDELGVPRPHVLT
ncbi:cupin domain-containing protein [Mycobacterium sp.]|uniref:cupin domain-containing protein n=1 Tax=Mycobacterium sp. TaxID=1785 RepID=UPI00262AD675|nr:cupin domain-containing protein [Mycobacterium sp.]